MDSKEIADRLDGMIAGRVQLIRQFGSLALLVSGDYVTMFPPADLLAFCRAVVEKIDGPTFTIEQIDNYVYNNTFCATPYEYSRVWNDALEDTRNRLKDPKDGIAALVKRDKEMA